MTDPRPGGRTPSPDAGRRTRALRWGVVAAGAALAVLLVVTGLLFVDPEARDLHDAVGTVETPLNQLSDAELVPGTAALEKINAGLR